MYPSVACPESVNNSNKQKINFKIEPENPKQFIKSAIKIDAYVSVNFNRNLDLPTFVMDSPRSVKNN